MPRLQVRTGFNKKNLHAIFGLIIVVLVLGALVLSYPTLQLALAEKLISAGKFAQAESILLTLSTNKQQRLKAGYRLVACQLFQGKGREAAQTVLSLTGAKGVDDLELAIVFLDVAKHLVDSGNAEAALELSKRVKTQSDGEMVTIAVKEISMLVAKYSELPLALEAVNLALAQGESNWQSNQKAFNLLLFKALESPPLLAEPALDRALQLYPNNAIAIMRKASIIGDKEGPLSALEYLKHADFGREEGLVPEYLAVKRSLLLRLAGTNPNADLTQYTRGMPQDMIIDIAKQGLNIAWSNLSSGYQYYCLAPDEPQIVYQYGLNLVQARSWDAARQTFRHLEKTDPDYLDFRAVYSVLDSKTKTRLASFAPDETVDAFEISPDGKWLAWRKWRQHPGEQFMVSELILTNLTVGETNPASLGDAVAFRWSPDSKYLAVQVMTAAGQGRLNIITAQNGLKYSLPPDWDIVEFNWALDKLMVQALRGEQAMLFALAAPTWETAGEFTWSLASQVNPDFCWLALEGKNLVVHSGQAEAKSFGFSKELMAFSPWSPSGNLAIIEDVAGRSWLFNSKDDSIVPVEIPGKFAAWGNQQDYFWYLPLWNQLYVLVRINNQGRIREYCPFSFDSLYTNLSIATDGRVLAFMNDNNTVLIATK